MPGDLGATVVTNARAFYSTRAAAGASGTRHSPLPPWGSARSLYFGAKDSCTTRAYHVAGMLRCILPSLRAKRSNPLLFSLLPHGLLRVARKDGVDGPRRHQCARLVISIGPDKGAVHERD